MKRGRFDPDYEQITVVQEPRHTRNHFGPLSAIAGQKLDVLERHANGDCTCFVCGRYLVAVDHRDIEPKNVTADNADGKKTMPEEQIAPLPVPSPCPMAVFPIRG